MQNTKIHQGLENSNLRDFFAISMVKTYEEEFNIKKKSIRDTNYIDSEIQNCENEIMCLQKKLEVLKARQSLMFLLKKQGWEEFDVSDVTVKDLNYTFWLNFIGTQEEYDCFVKNLELNEQ